MAYRKKGDDRKMRVRGLRDCPHCHVRVMFAADGVCPSCRSSAHDPVVDDGLRRVTMQHRTPLPSICARCGEPTTRRQKSEGTRVSEGERPWLRVLLFLFWSPFVALLMPGANRRSVGVALPVCRTCAKDGEIWPEHVDFEHGTLTLLVHKNLADAISAAEVEP